MSVFKSLWASVQGDPVFMRRLNGWLTVFWVAMIPTAFAALMGSAGLFEWRLHSDLLAKILS